MRRGICVPNAAVPLDDAYDVGGENGPVADFLETPSQRLGVLVAAVLVGLPPTPGQSTEAGRAPGDRTDEQASAIEMADEVASRLRAMPWGPEVVDALSRSGGTACGYDRDLGVRLFETAYSVATGSELDLNEESWLETLSDLASAAARCHSDFADRALTRGGPESTLSAVESLDAALSTMQTDPQQTAAFAQGVASQFHTLPRFRQPAFIEVLWALREQRPGEADGLFRAAVLGAASHGTIESLSAIGNYVFGPDGPESAMKGAVAQFVVSGETAHGLRFLRPRDAQQPSPTPCSGEGLRWVKTPSLGPSCAA